MGTHLESSAAATAPTRSAPAAAVHRPVSGSKNRGILEVTQGFVGRSLRVTELDDGYALAYPNTPEWSERLAAIRDHWQTGLPYFQVAAPRAENKLLWLHITGPAPDAKPYLHSLIARTGQHADLPRKLWRRLTLAGRIVDRGERELRLLTAGLRVLPDFLVIGAAKCGTGTLHANLTAHPSVVPARDKELYHFDHAFGRGLKAYRSHFPTSFTRRRVVRRGHGFATGEFTPCYLFHPHVPRRVAESLPSVKLIVLLRNPVDRAYAEHRMKIRMGLDPLSFEEALDAEPQRVAGELGKMQADPSYFSHDRWHYSYQGRGVYADQLEAWFAHFPREQFRIVASEDLYASPAREIAAIAEFLGLPAWAPESPEFRNVIPCHPMAPETRQRLVEYFAPHNERLYDLLGRRFDWDR